MPLDPAIEEMTEEDFETLKKEAEENPEGFTKAELECLKAIENGNCPNDCSACPIYAKMEQ